MIELTIFAFSLGLVSNLHCIGMCGPIALALPLNRSSKLTKIKGISFYSLGRSIGYSLLGALVGLIGMSANLLGVLQWLSIISGLLIILFAWRGYFNIGISNSKFSMVIHRFMSSFLKNKSKRGNTPLLSFGFVNAFLPCGMVYAALLAAMNFGGILNAMLFMFIFGIGTSPGFFAIALVNFFKSPYFGKKIIVASFVSIVGLAMVVRGMNLDIPIISPKLNVTKSDEGMEEASFSCCSSKTKDKEDATCVDNEND